MTGLGQFAPCRWALWTVLAGMLTVPVAAQAGPRDEQWKKVDEAVNKGLPKTAIELLGPIIDGAIKDKAYAEAIKGVAKRVAYEGNIQGNKAEEKITRLKDEIAKAPLEMKPVLEAILANWYWHFFQQNRWRFMQRTQTASSPGNDILTWDLPRILAEIDQQFGKALAAADSLKKTPVAQYNDLLQKGTSPDAYRPTMYDFLVHDALQFYTAGEQAGAKAQDAFELSAGSPIFSSTDEFIAWPIPTTDETSVTVRALRLYQDLLKFHAPDDDRSAYLDADLWRLSFGYNKAVGEEKNARYKAALQRFADAHQGHELSTRALAEWAVVVRIEGDLVTARSLAKQGTARFPDSIGGKQCHNLILQIEAKQSSLHLERVWNAPLSPIQIRYRNLKKVYFRVVPANWEDRIRVANRRPEWIDQAERKEFLATQPVHSWSVDLPATEDFQERLEEIPAPANLKPGFYFLLASHDESFGEANNVVNFADFWVSDLAIVLRNRQAEGVIEGFVLNAITGEPVVEAEVKSWEHNTGRAAGPHTTTDKNGFFRFSGIHQRSLTILAKTRDQQLATAHDAWAYQGNVGAREYARTIFFTDRALYRPGQTVQYKGICIQVNAESDNYKTLANQTLTVVFQDVNGKEILRQKHQANDYGSFHGSATAPRDRLLGRMTLRVDGEPSGATQVYVEEYKRPKFQVALDAPKTAAKLNGDVRLQGKATAYTGAAIDGAKVNWRVVRQVRYPEWWGWCFWWRMPQTNSQEIAHGVATTAADGTFPIEFKAKPDTSVIEKDEPTFSYSISADVTDPTGETRSAQRTVQVGYTALKASVSAGDWQTAGPEKPVELSVNTSTLDGEGQAAECVVKIYALKQPATVVRSRLGGTVQPRRRAQDGSKEAAEPQPDPANTHSWPLGEVVAETKLSTDATGKANYRTPLAAGIYRVMLETSDRFGKPVTARLPLQVYDPAAPKLGIKLPEIFAAPKWTLEPGAKFTALWGTGYDQARAFIEIEHRRKIVQAYWTDPAKTQAAIEQEVTEAMRGGFTVRVTMVRENRAYLESRRIDVPWTNKQLTVKWERFTSKLEPAQKETWTAIVTGPNAQKAVAEVAATLYDASLDAYRPHQWQQAFNVFRQDHSPISTQFENLHKQFQYLHGQWPMPMKDATLTYRRLPDDITANLWGYSNFGRNRMALARGLSAAKGADKRETAEYDAAGMDEKAAAGEQQRAKQALNGLQSAGGQPEASPNLDQVAARTNLNETAFFFPHVTSTKDGEVRLEFVMPEALTEWKFMAFAHDQELRGGALQDKIVTAKDLMIQPNPPRFVREGDLIEFTVKVSNQSASNQTGKVRLTLADARTLASIDGALGNLSTDQAFDIPAKESRTFAWKLKVPDGLGFLTYKTVGSAGRVSDGEEGYLPVLARRILVTESLPLPIRGKQTKTFDFDKLVASGKSDSLQHKTLTLQVTSQPAWYAVMALPYLMESPHPCSEQVFNRLYANALARHIAGSDPKIACVFEQWKGTATLDSPLMKNQDLKSVLLEETPWYRQAVKESEARRNVAILFDTNRLNDETARGLKQLAEMQGGDGLWPWFPGGRSNEYMTLYITTGFGRLRHLGVPIDMAPAVKSLAALDGWVNGIYREILRHGHKDDNHLSTTIALYLYGRSFFLDDRPVAPENKEAVDYFLAQAKKYWLPLNERQSQAQLALALKRFGDKETAVGIMASLKERSVSNEELGMFWRDLERSFSWFRAPIETQAVMIEAFDEVTNDRASVEDCKVWLLKQKQTQDWKTTKATADAVYALLLRGANLLASDALLDVSLGGTPIKPETVEAGTGYYEQRFVGGEIKPELGKVTLKKVDDGVAWGALHWQYLEDTAKVTPHEGTPLTIRKTLHTKVNSKKGPVLQPLAGPAAVGDQLVVRIELRTDRDLEYVHLKDQRGSGTEPTNVLSQYKYQDGLGYYESTRDTASHFFIDYLPKGTYVFEYSVRVQHRGEYQSGLATVQCMYAPEFNSHSASVGLVVK